MGIGRILTGILGFDGSSNISTPAQSAQTRTATDTQTKSAEDIAAEKEQKRKSSIVAINAGAAIPKTTVGGGNANVTRRTLLGL